MHFLVYPTERCNLKCSYCDTEEESKNLVKDRTYTLPDIISFLQKSGEPGITFYGGEPTFEPNFITNLMDNVDFSYISIVTNGYKLHEIPLNYLKKMNMVSISLDGSETTTDSRRGKGAYKNALGSANYLKENNYNGFIAARMTCTEGNNIENDVKHLANLKAFDLIHWQLDVFHKETIKNYQCFGKWLVYEYNKQISNLIDYWLEEMKKGNLIKIVPFIGIMDTLLTKNPVENIRCGAGHKFFVISTEGKIFSCPLFRDEGEELSTIWQSPGKLEPAFRLNPPCTNCNYFQVCGGRCLYLNKIAANKKIYSLLCHSTKHLIKELNKIKPQVEELIKENILSIEDFKHYYEHEVIP